METLIDNNTGCWDMEKIQSLLPQLAVAEVLKIPIPLEPREDKLNWEHEKSGQYSVRSGYRWCKIIEKRNKRGECSDAEKKNKLWKMIWKLKTAKQNQGFLLEALFQLHYTSSFPFNFL